MIARRPRAERRSGGMPSAARRNHDRNDTALSPSDTHCAARPPSLRSDKRARHRNQPRADNNPRRALPLLPLAPPPASKRPPAPRAARNNQASTPLSASKSHEPASRAPILPQKTRKRSFYRSLSCAFGAKPRKPLGHNHRHLPDFARESPSRSGRTPSRPALGTESSSFIIDNTSMLDILSETKR